jgi:hypothetical protein
MTQINDIETGHETRYETPSFAPSSAFAWTLRSGEIARRKAQQTGGSNGSRPRSYETPAFDPRGAFSWTLRSGEIAARERRRLRLTSPKQLDVLVAA